MQYISATISRRNIGTEKTGAVWEHTIRADRKIVGTICEPCKFHPGTYRVNVRIAPGYALVSETRSMPDAVLEFDRLTDGKYTFNA